MSTPDAMRSGAAPVERRLASAIEFIRRAGPGMPIVLLHGVGSNASSFARLINHIDARHLLLAWNAPGYGASAPLSIDWPSPTDYGAALERLLDDGTADGLSNRRAIIVGHSLGTLMAARFAVTRPERCDRLRYDPG